MFISIQGSKDWKLFHSPSKRWFWRNQVDSRNGFKLRRSKVRILKKPTWRKLEESVTPCNILECLSFSVELMPKNHTHLHKFSITKLLQKHFKNTLFLIWLLTVIYSVVDSWRKLTVDRLFLENCRQIFTVSQVFVCFDSLSTVQKDCRSWYVKYQMCCRQVFWTVDRFALQRLKF